MPRPRAGQSGPARPVSAQVWPIDTDAESQPDREHADATARGIAVGTLLGALLWGALLLTLATFVAH